MNDVENKSDLVRQPETAGFDPRPLFLALSGLRPCFWIDDMQPFRLGGLEKLSVGGNEEHRLLQGQL